MILTCYVSPRVFSLITDCKGYDDAISTLENLFVKPKNEVFARHLLATRKQESGFPIGHSVEAKTKGIWIYIMRHPVDSEKTLILLDTEGLSDATKSSRDHDADIFTLCTLLCSHFVYNSTGKIDQDAIDKLKLICDMTNHIHTKAHQDTEETGDDFYRFFPTFIWVIRDFSLSLEVKGNSLTADEYLEESLKLDHGVTFAAQQKNAVRYAIKKFFKTRKCFALSIPPTSNKDMKLESLHDSQLQPKFLTNVKNFSDYTLHEPNVMTVGKGMKINGSMYLELTKLYVEEIRKGDIPSVVDAADAMSHIVNSQAVENGIEVYENNMRRAITFPIANSQLCEYHKIFSDEASKVFMSKVIYQNLGEHQEKFQLCVDAIYRKITKENSMTSIEKCENLIHELYEPTKKMMTNGGFAVEGGYNKYCNLLEKLEQDFNSEKYKGDRDVEVLSNFLNERETEKINILMSDNMIPKQKRETEVQILEAKVNKRKRYVVDDKKKRIDEAVEALKRSHESNLKDVRTAYEKQLKDIEEKYERMLYQQKEEFTRCKQINERTVLKEKIENLKREKADQLKHEENSFWDTFKEIAGSLLIPLLFLWGRRLLRL